MNFAIQMKLRNLMNFNILTNKKRKKEKKKEKKRKKKMENHKQQIM